MGKRDPQTGKRVLTFMATGALVVAPVAFTACGGAKGAPEAGNVGHTEETTNVGPEDAQPEATNVDHTEEPHTNVGPEDEGGGDEAAPE